MHSEPAHSRLACRYHDIKLILALARLLVLSLFLSAFYLNEWGYLLSGKLLFSPRMVTDGIFLLIFYTACNAMFFPLELFDDYLMEKRYRLSSQSFVHWCIDYGKSFLLGGIIFVAAGLAFYSLLRRGGTQWYIATWSIFVILNWLLAMIVPRLIIPIFFKYRTIEDMQFKERLLSLAEAHGVKLKDLFVINASSKSSKANAFICGLGKTRRLVLTDTLLSDFSHDEIEAAVAHELAHIIRRDSGRLFAMNSIAGFFFFFIAAKAAHFIFRADMPLLYDIGSLSFFAWIFFMLNLAASPLRNASVRHVEQAADRLSFSFLKQTRGFISLMEKLCAHNLSEYRPPAWKEYFFFSHPSPERRIREAQAWERKSADQILG